MKLVPLMELSFPGPDPVEHHRRLNSYLQHVQKQLGLFTSQTHKKLFERAVALPVDGSRENITKLFWAAHETWTHIWWDRSKGPVPPVNEKLIELYRQIGRFIPFPFNVGDADYIFLGSRFNLGLLEGNPREVPTA
jgi:hypothetical protein